MPVVALALGGGFSYTASMQVPEPLVAHAVDVEEVEFGEVFDLYRKHSATLGHLPRGAFEQFAREGHLLAVRIEGRVAGYVAYRVARRHVALVHLCVRPESRGNGVATALMTALIDAASDVGSIRLSCREDYVEANRLWPRFQFVCRGERPGRGRAGGRLFVWERRSGGDLPLLEMMREVSLGERLLAVLDANVFFDLDSDDPEADESKSLLADWLEADVALCVTAELSNEIMRHPSETVRARRRAQLRGFEVIEAAAGDLATASARVDLVLPPPTSQSVSDESDRRQLAHGVAKGAAFFITRDHDFLDHADVLREAVGVEVLRPADFVVRAHLDAAPSAYQPARLVGTLVQERLVRAAEEMKPFQRFAHGEKKSSWDARCRHALASVPQFESRVITPGDASPKVLYTVDLSTPAVLRIMTLRCLSHSLTSTLVRRVVSELLVRAQQSGRRVVQCEDVRDPVVMEALHSLDFHIREDGTYIRLTIPGVLSRHRLAELIESSLYAVPEGLAAAPAATPDHELERVFWPLKIRDSETASFVVPIRPHWAAQLFDTGLAERDLFGATESIALALENVFYSGSRVDIPPGARILWYVSGTGRRAIREIRACSQSLGTVRGPARRLFPRFARLGVYRWRDVLTTANGDPAGEISAYQFALTERLSRPLSWTRLQDLLGRMLGHGNPIAGPTRIGSAVFDQLYAEATGCDA